MFARVTTYELGDGRATESIEAFEPAIDSLRDLEGFVDAFFLLYVLHPVFAPVPAFAQLPFGKDMEKRGNFRP